MKRVIVVLLVIVLLPAFAAAQNIGKCGWGSKLFEGQRGIAPQVLAATTNGTSGNQTFAITSGTSGCTQDGVVKSNWETAAYMDANLNKVARDMSRGSGEGMDTLAVLLGVEDQDKEVFAKVLQENYGEIFSSEKVSSAEVLVSMKHVLAEHPELSGYAVNI